MFDYNQEGAQYISFAFAGNPTGLGYLKEDAVDAIQIAKALVHEAAGKSPPQEPLAHLFCALERLDGLILISKRITDAIRSLPSRILPHPFSPPPCLAYINATDIFVDFSSLVYHGASTVDILSKFYTSESGVANNGHFRGSPAKIYNLQPPDIRADHLWQDLTRFENDIGIIFTGDGTYKGLRNALAHENSVHGLSCYTYCAQIISDRSAIIFDCEIEIPSSTGGSSKLFPISRTVNTIVSLVTWIVCRTAFCYLTRTRQGAILKHPSYSPGFGPDHFAPVWKSPLAVFSEHVSDDGTGMKFSTLHLGWNGYQTKNRILKPSVMEHRVPPYVLYEG